MAGPRLEAPPAPQGVAASRVSGLALEQLTRASPRRGRVHSTFTRAWNVELGDGRLLVVHGPGPLRAPLAVALSEPAIPQALGVGAAVAMTRHRLEVAGLAIDLEAAEPIDVMLPPADVGPHPLEEAIGGVAGAETDGVMPLRRASAALGGAIERRDAGALIGAARGLIGLGAGLTPAGDDVLVGAFAALHRFAARWLAEHPGIGAELAAAARAGTTPIARDFLEHALAGAFSELILDVVAAPSPAPARVAAKRLLGFGATSGAETLGGLRLALRALAAG
jgi:Protein of unknown function (DUF2877)